MNYPKISIVTPNYNNAKFLEQTIVSVLSQHYPNLEYIIIDGGSTDGSVDIIKKYEHQLAFWLSEPDNGVYDAVKKGFEHSTGDIMAWIGSDDIYHCGALFVVAEIFSTFHDVSWLSGCPTVYDELGRTVRVVEGEYISRLNLLMCNCKQYIQQESTFWRRSLYDKAGGVKTDYRLAGDFDLWMRFSRYEKRYVVNALIGGFRKRDGQLSKNVDDYWKEVSSIISKEPVSKDELKGMRNVHFRKSLVAILKVFGLFNWQGFSSVFNMKHEAEEKMSKISFDFDKKEFVKGIRG